MDNQVHTIINVQGDNVQNKTVEHEIGSVAEGGIGIQMNTYNHYHNENGGRIPREKDYNGVREYVNERMNKDIAFKEYWNNHKWTDRADYLTGIFGWEVDEHAMSVNFNRHK